MNKSDCAVECFKNGFNCSQAVFSAYSSELGLDTEMALKVAGAFGGGMGHTGEVCGAVSGALMLIGLKYGKTKKDDNEAKERTYALVKEFSRRFKEIHGTVRCTELLGYDLSSEEQLIAARDKGLFSSVCPKLVKDACEIVETLL
ncbi:MAG: C-GCAxxG-C-C family protein [Bacillota bacterium]|nr:C-GCAxxG-C-C family protein [Bacillota bacterium]